MRPILFLILSCQLLLAQDGIRVVYAARPPGAIISSLNTNLVSYWKMDETSGTRIDSEPTGTPQDFTDASSVGSTTGIIGNAGLFVAASTDSISHIDSIDLSVGNIDFSVVLWAKLTTTNALEVLISHWAAASNQRGWYILWDSATSRFKLNVSSTGSDTTTLTASNFGSATTGVWYMIFISHDSVGNTINISVNDGTPDSVAYTLGVKDSTAAFTVGALGSSPGGSYANAAIDGIGFWKKVLSAAEITELYNGGAAKTCCPF
jgi:hypothetical protein